MGQRGPAPKPTALKLLAGNPGKRRLNTSEPQPPRGAPGCPTWLDTEAKAEWRRIVPELERLGLLTKVDRAALAAFCQAWSDYKAAVQAVRQDGKTFLTESGYIAKNPMVTIMNEAADRLHKFGQQFGLSPASRTRLHAPKDEGDKPDDAARFFG